MTTVLGSASARSAAFSISPKEAYCLLPGNWILQEGKKGRNGERRKGRETTRRDSNSKNSRGVGLLLQIEKSRSTSTDLASVRSDGDGNSDDNSVLELSDDLGELDLESRNETGLSPKSNLVGSLSLGAARVKKGRGQLGRKGLARTSTNGRERGVETYKETSPAWARASSGPPHETMISRSRDPPAPMRDRWNCRSKKVKVSRLLFLKVEQTKLKSSNEPGAQSKRCCWSPLQRSQRQRE